MKLDNPLLRDHAVIQAGRPLPVSGTAAPGGEITVAFRGRQVRTRADDRGRWQAELPPQPAGGPDTLTVSAPGAAGLTVGDLLVGEVWVCAGQSNMGFRLSESEGAGEELPRAGRPGLRLCKVPRRVAATAQADLDPGCAWQASTPETAAGFSALGYFFGAHLNASLAAPVGLVMATCGETPGEAWLARAALAGDPDFEPIFERERRALAAYPDAGGAYRQAFAEWDRVADLAEREGRPLPGAHPVLIGPGHHWIPGGIFNGMVAPLLAHPIRGVIWAQGEAAPERAWQYRKLFPLLIRHWRAAWGQGDFPFIFVQAAAYGPRRAEPGEHSWAELREAQQLGLREPRTAMIVTLDCGAAHDIHPRRKQPVGERLALAALDLAYGRRTAWCGPLFSGWSLEGRRVRVRFDHADGLRAGDGQPLRGFALSGGAADFSRGHRGFHWAAARVEGREVVLAADAVPAPRAARYAWAQNPDGNLVNAAGLPAAPFRTDDYPGVTQAVR